MTARKVLFVTYGGGHVAMAMPVIRQLQARHPDWSMPLMALTTGAQIAKRGGFESLGYQDFAHWYEPATLHALAAPLMTDTQHPLVSREETEAYLGINLADLHATLGSEAARALYARRGRWAFHPLPFMRRLMKELKPDVVVATNSPRSEAAALEAASEQGIPSLCMVDLFSPAGDPFFARTHYADVITTIDELGRRNLAAGGVPSGRIRITGSPAFDALASPERISQARAERAQRGWQDLKVILWAGNREECMPAHGPESDPSWLALQVEQRLRAFVASHPEAALIIRYHPNQVQHFSSGEPQPRVLWSDPLSRPAHLDIQMADIVVVNGSTVGLEAAMAGKSVLSMDNSPSRHIFPLSDFGVSRGVASFDDLEPMLLDSMARPHRSGFADQNGHAAERVAGLIESLAFTGQA
jgi:hypothetical protein